MESTDHAQLVDPPEVADLETDVARGDGGATPRTSVQREIDSLLLSGKATTVAEAERLILDAHLRDIVDLAERLPDDEFRRHELVRLLLAHGSRPWEDSLT
jgi:hypothetical protein